MSFILGGGGLRSHLAFGDCNAQGGKAAPAQILRFAPNFTAHQRRGPEGPYRKWAGDSR